MPMDIRYYQDNWENCCFHLSTPLYSFFWETETKMMERPWTKHRQTIAQFLRSRCYHYWDCYWRAAETPSIVSWFVFEALDMPLLFAGAMLKYFSSTQFENWYLWRTFCLMVFVSSWLSSVERLAGLMPLPSIFFKDKKSFVMLCYCYLC